MPDYAKPSKTRADLPPDTDAIVPESAKRERLRGMSYDSQLAAVQFHGAGALARADTHAIAAEGVQGSGGPLCRETGHN